MGGKVEKKRDDENYVNRFSSFDEIGMCGATFSFSFFVFLSEEEKYDVGTYIADLQSDILRAAFNFPESFFSLCYGRSGTV